MALSSARCLANYKALRTLPAATNDPVVAAAQGDALMQAIFQSMIQEIQANGAVSVTGVQPGSGTAPGTIA